MRKSRQLFLRTGANGWTRDAFDDDVTRVVRQVRPWPPASLKANLVAVTRGQNFDDRAASAAL